MQAAAADRSRNHGPFGRTMTSPGPRRCPIPADDPLPPDDLRIGTRPPGLAELYRRQGPRLLRMFSRRANEAEAQDLLHDAFARVAGRVETAGPEIAEPAAYLTRIATNLLRDRAKFAVRSAAAHHQTFDDAIIAGGDEIQRLEARDALRRLEAAVTRLKPRQREVFLLQRTQGLSYAEIAEQTGMSVKGVKKQMANALFELRRELGPR